MNLETLPTPDHRQEALPLQHRVYPWLVTLHTLSTNVWGTGPPAALLEIMKTPLPPEVLSPLITMLTPSPGERDAVRVRRMMEGETHDAKLPKTEGSRPPRGREEEEEEGEREGADMEMLSPGEMGMEGMKERVRVLIASSNMTWRVWGLGFRA